MTVSANINYHAFPTSRESVIMKQRQYPNLLSGFPKYEYICYCSNLAGDALYWHELYCQRATSENWIEQVKNQLLAGATTTDNFFGADMLWQLSILAYNLSVMMRYRVKKLWRQEHGTFRDWSITIPAKLLQGGRQFKLKIYEHYYDKEKWLKFGHKLSLSN